MKILNKVKVNIVFFYKSECKEEFCIFSWLDDLDIASTSEEELQKLKVALEKIFKMDNCGELKWFLGIKILRHISI